MSNTQLSTPVALIIFNRPDTTKLVFNAIRQAKPLKLFLIADAPRAGNADDAKKCKEVRSIVENVDWPCEVKKNYSNKNLGCGKRPVSGIAWVFENVDRAIILEDDCLPHPSFFTFCQQLLEYYYDDKRIMHISGNNFQFGKKRGNASYYYSRFSHSWGWATWRRAWEHYDFEMKSYPDFLLENKISAIFNDKKAQKYWTVLLSDVYAGKIVSVWDYQWTYTTWVQNGLCILPNVNLVSNIGFNEFATHTSDQKNRLSNMPVGNIQDIVHPTVIVEDVEADRFTNKTLFLPKSSIGFDNITGSFKNAVRKIIGLIKSNYANPTARLIPNDMNDPFFLELVKKCRPFTMTSIERMFSLYKSIEYIIRNNIRGDFVECGLWRGGSAMIMAFVLQKHKVINKKIYLYDTFSGMSQPSIYDQDIQGSNAAELWGQLGTKNETIPWCYCSLDDVKKNLMSTGYPADNIFLIKGKVEDSIPGQMPDEISLLRLDTDWYESTKHELIYLYPLLTKNGVLIIDDYGHWQGAKKAVDEYFQLLETPPFLARIDYTCRLCIKI